MHKWSRRIALGALTLAMALPAFAQTVIEAAPTPQPVITVTASASMDAANDRMYAVLRAEADDPDPVRAADAVNGRMARALSRAKAVPGVEARSAGYSSYQISEPNRPPRWRVSQALALEGGDFAALSALVSKLQGTDGLLLSSLSFGVSADARRAADDALTQEAIKRWQARAKTAARAFGATGYRAGRVTIQTNDYGRPQPMLKAGMAAAAAAPVSVEGGTTEVTVTVSGEAILER
jgi:predicted secreted protein